MGLFGMPLGMSKIVDMEDQLTARLLNVLFEKPQQHRDGRPLQANLAGSQAISKAPALSTAAASPPKKGLETHRQHRLVFRNARWARPRTVEELCDKFTW